MQYRGLRAFCAVAQRGSFKAAAEELCVTASAVSHQIRDLEAYLGTRLFHRHARSIEITPDGHQFLAAIAPHIQAIDDAAAQFRGEQQQARLAIQMPAFFASEVFLPEMTSFSAAHRNIDLRIETTNPMETGNVQVDINIELSRHRPQLGTSMKLFPIEYQPACSPDVLARWNERWRGDLAGIEEATLLVHKARPDAWQHWLSAAGAPNLRARQTISVDSMYGLARAAEQGLGLALIPLPVSQQWFSTGKLVPLFRELLVSEDSYWLTRTEHAQEGDALDTLCDWIIKRFARTDDVYSSVA